MMYVRSANLPDPERQIDEKIMVLRENEIGNVSISSFKYNGQILKFDVHETILKANLETPLFPGDSAVFELKYETKIPLLIRRAGRSSAEGIDYSMSQWFPKIAAYDDEGFHPDVHLGREFYGVFGDYEVIIDIDDKYKVAAGAHLMGISKQNNQKSQYHFKADMIHDFVWAADRDYMHYQIEADSSIIFNFYYQNTEKRHEVWKKLGPIMKEAYAFINKRYGKYQYKLYNFIEGGDGGMEYPLATLITGDRDLNSLVGISVHEFMHSWFHTIIATNESKYHWMDEGFTSFATIEVLQFLISKGLIDRKLPIFPFQDDYNYYNEYMNSYYVEPMITHSDHFSSNYAYGISAYINGMIFLKQMEYIIGKKSFDEGLIKYFDTWKFKSPKPKDFVRIMEKVSDLELRWYLDYFVNLTRAVDYSIDTVFMEDDIFNIDLIRVNNMPMPVDISIEFSDQSIKYFTIPLDLMFGTKKEDIFEFEVLPIWKWVDRKYRFSLSLGKKEIKKIIIDPSLRLADIDRSTNVWVKSD
jgi:hypothetical protein